MVELKQIKESVSGHFDRCREYINGNIYYKALDEVHKAKYDDPKNIYIIDLEKKIKELNKPGISQNRESEILETLPSIMEHALGDIVRRSSMPEQDADDELFRNYVISRDEAVALVRLKERYFSLIEECIEGSQYKRALEELNRVFIIDPNDKVAKGLEKKIKQIYNGDKFTDEKKETTKHRSGVKITVISIILILIISIITVIFLMMAGGNDDEIHSSVITNLELYESSIFSNESNTLNEPSITESGVEIRNDIGSREEIFRAAVEVDQIPEISRLNKPEYPADAIRDGLEGVVIVRVLLDEDGNPVRNMILQSTHSQFEGPALEAAQHSEFNPPDQFDGLALPFVDITYRFRLIRQS